MLRTIDVSRLSTSADSPILGKSSPCEDAIVRREWIESADRAEAMLAQAHEQADAVLARAHQQAQACCEAGFQRGVHAGVNATLAPMLEIVSKLHAFKHALRVEAAEALRASLRSLLAQAPMVEALLDSVVEARPPKPSSVVWIRVPAPVDGQAVIRHGEALGLNLRLIEAGPEDKFSISWDGHVWEADIEGFCRDFELRGAASASASKSEPSDAQAQLLCRRALIAAAQKFDPQEGASDT